MGFEEFYALKQIMVCTLTNLSDENMQQNDKIRELDEKERALKRELENLKRIEEENKRKERRLEQ